MNHFLAIYEWLYNSYGPQGWWPLISIKGTNPTKTGVIKGYHPGDYSYPKNSLQRWEIIMGAILTQNTSWTNVEKALINLKKNNVFKPEEIIKIDKNKLSELIRSSGYYNQKAERLKLIAEWFLSTKRPTREELLKIKGVGPETADSILLYAYKIPTFVIDSYTRRILLNLNIITPNHKYDNIKALFETNIPKDYKIYQEYHALLVEHAKRYYTKKNMKDPLRKIIRIK